MHIRKSITYNTKTSYAKNIFISDHDAVMFSIQKGCGSDDSGIGFMASTLLFLCSYLKRFKPQSICTGTCS